MNIRQRQPQRVPLQRPLRGKEAGVWAAWTPLGCNLALLAYARCVALSHSPNLSEPLFPNSVNLQNARILENELCPREAYGLVDGGKIHAAELPPPPPTRGPV